MFTQTAGVAEANASPRPSTSTSPNPSPDASSSNGPNTAVLAAAVSAGVVGIAALAAVAVLLMRKRAGKHSTPNSSLHADYMSVRHLTGSSDKGSVFSHLDTGYMAYDQQAMPQPPAPQSPTLPAPIYRV